MTIKPIRTNAQYKVARIRIEQLWGAKPGTPAGEELDVLITLVDAYETDHHAIAPPRPIDAILFRMEQLGWTRAEFAKLLGSQSRASEILSRKRPLSVNMIKTIHRKMGVPAESLLAD